MCSERSRTRRAVGSCERSASCGRAPRSVCGTWPTTFAASTEWAETEAGKTIVNRTEPELAPKNASSASQPLMAGTVIALPFGQPPAEPLPAVAGLRKAAMPDGEHRTLFSDHKHSVHPLGSPQRVECLTGSLCDWS